MTMHEEWTDKLSDYIDGELSAEEQRAVAAHVAQCGECARAVEQLRGIVQMAGTLTPVAPTADLWTGIADRIANQHTPRILGGPWFSSRRFSFTMPQIAAASLLLALLSGWAALRFIPRNGAVDAPRFDNASSPDSSRGDLQVRPAVADVTPAAISVDDSEYDAAVAELTRALDNGRGRLDPTTVKVVEDNLAIIDQAVDEARRALTEDPANGFLSGYLIETRRRKLDLLRQAAALTEELN